MSALRKLRARAAKIGVRIDAERDDFGWGYWLLDAKSGEGVWDDGNFCDNLSEVEYKLDGLEMEGRL